MNIRQAILKAADHIQGNPSLFNFFATEIPGSCGTPGCALGWIGHFAGHTSDSARVAGGNERATIAVARSVLGLTASTDHIDCQFYRRMDAIDGTFVRWRYTADDCARALRLYADKYHPVESRALIPESVARIFRMPHAELTREIESA